MAIPRGEDEERVTNLELFFDLVFVFAITQVTLLMSEEPTWAGLGKGMLVLTALWFAWASYAWLTNTLDPEEGGVRLAIFVTMAALLSWPRWRSRGRSPTTRWLRRRLPDRARDAPALYGRPARGRGRSGRSCATSRGPMIAAGRSSWPPASCTAPRATSCGASP